MLLGRGGGARTARGPLLRARAGISSALVARRGGRRRQERPAPLRARASARTASRRSSRRASSRSRTSPSRPSRRCCARCSASSTRSPRPRRQRSPRRSRSARRSRGDRFTVSAATLSLLAAAAEEQPLLVLVDDGQWIDRASAEALLFAARRLVAEGILILFTQREDVGELDTHRAPRPAPRRARREGRRASSCRSASAAASRPRSRSASSPRPAGTRSRSRSCPRLLNPGQLDGTEPLDEPLPVGAALEGALGAKIRALPDDAQKALLVAAASGSPRMEAIAPAVARARPRSGPLRAGGARRARDRRRRAS